MILNEQKKEQLTPIGNWLENKRKMRVVSRFSWCGYLGITEPTYRGIIYGNLETQPSTLQKIFERLGYSPEDGMAAVEEYARERAA